MRSMRPLLASASVSPTSSAERLPAARRSGRRRVEPENAFVYGREASPRTTAIRLIFGEPSPEPEGAGPVEARDTPGTSPPATALAKSLARRKAPAPLKRYRGETRDRRCLGHRRRKAPAPLKREDRDRDRPVHPRPLAQGPAPLKHRRPALIRCTLYSCRINGGSGAGCVEARMRTLRFARSPGHRRRLAPAPFKHAELRDSALRRSVTSAARRWLR
jgi:hypothetical protein